MTTKRDGTSIRLFGPVSAWDGATELDIGPARQRTVLAALAITPGYPVPLEVLIDRVWGETPPNDPRGTLYSHIARLRKALAPAGIGIVTGSGGYLCELATDGVDVALFRGRVREARDLVRADSPDPRRAAATARAALALWTAVPLTGIAGEWAERTGAALSQERLEAILLLADCASRIGGQPDLVEDLGGWAREYPLSETLAAYLIRALCAAGRPAEALDHYGRLREGLVEAVGAEPSAELQRLHLRMLREDPELVGGSGRSTAGEETPVGAAVLTTTDVPRQLPAPTAAFCGRADQLEQVGAVLAGEPIGHAATAAIYGLGGVGKSALALEAAHRAVERYPDGQLYADLQGASPDREPLEPTEVLTRFLHALGVQPGGVPSDPAEAVSEYRSRLADRQVLILLDNAADAAQVRPLLPTQPGSAAVVTSRRALTTLDAAIHCPLDLLSPEESRTLLGRLDPAGRCADDPAMTDRLVELCGRLPLALRILGARLAARPGRLLGGFLERLSDSRRRLDELAHADLEVRSCFDLAYRTLERSADPVDRAAAVAFRWLALSDGPDLGAPIAARLLDLDDKAADDVLERLLDAQLLGEPAPGRYQMHDLVRAYARELAEEHDSADVRRAALDRAWRAWSATAARATELLMPITSRPWPEDASPAVALGGRPEALDWFRAEEMALITALRQADEQGESVAVRLSLNVLPYYRYTGRMREAIVVAETAEETARTVGDEHAGAELRHARAMAIRQTGQPGVAIPLAKDVVEIHTRYGDVVGAAFAYNLLGTLHGLCGEFEPYLGHTERASRMFAELGDDRRRLMSETNRASALKAIGRLAECTEVRLAINDELRVEDDPLGKAIVLHNLGEDHRDSGRWQEAEYYFQETLRVGDEQDLEQLRAGTLGGLAEVAAAEGRHSEALRNLRAAMAFDQHALPLESVAQILTRYSHVLRLSGDANAALRYAEEALIFAREHELGFYEAEATWRLGEALMDTGNREVGERFLVSAHDRLVELGSPQAEQVRAVLDRSEEPDRTGTDA